VMDRRNDRSDSGRKAPRARPAGRRHYARARRRHSAVRPLIVERAPFEIHPEAEVSCCSLAVRCAIARRGGNYPARSGRNPARFSFAHGGKDRHPFPVPIKIYDETIRVLKSAVRKAKLGREEELGALRRLDDQARALERHARGPSVERLIAQERERSPSYGGRSVFGGQMSDVRCQRTENVI
jgi:hypothetical protein